MDICIPQEWTRVVEARKQRAQLEIQQVGDIYDAMIFELDSGRVGYIIDLRLTNHTSRPKYIQQVELRPPWNDDMFDWLTATEIPLHIRGNRKRCYVYRFPGKSAPEFPYDQVLNHHLVEEGFLAGKRHIRGLLLATGGLMPESLKDGQTLDMEVAVIDSDYAECAQSISLWTERSPARPRVTRNRTSLYEGLDRGSEPASEAERRLSPTRRSDTDLQAGANNAKEQEAAGEGRS